MALGSTWLLFHWEHHISNLSLSGAPKSSEARHGTFYPWWSTDNVPPTYIETLLWHPILLNAWRPQENVEAFGAYHICYFSSHHVRNVCIICLAGQCQREKGIFALWSQETCSSENQSSNWVEVMSTPDKFCQRTRGLTYRPNCQTKRAQDAGPKAVHGKRVRNKQLQGNSHDSSSDIFGTHFGSVEKLRCWENSM